MMICELCNSQRAGTAADGQQDITDDEFVDDGPQQVSDSIYSKILN